MTTGHWQSRREGGTVWSLRLIRWVALNVSERIARLSLYPITFYYLLLRATERRASRDYLARVGIKPSLLNVARHIHCFASTILDRVFLLTGRFDTSRVRVHGVTQLLGHLDQGQGVLLIGSHLGSFEAARVVGLARDELMLRILMDYQHNAQLSLLLDALNPRARDSIIDAGGDGTQVLLAMSETLDAGGLVGILADRARLGEATVPCTLLNAPVALPAGPFRLAAVLHRPVMLVFGIARTDGTYDVYFEPFANKLELGARGNRQAALQQWAQRYADRLQARMRDAPYNWFNFYDYWAVPASISQSAIPTASTP